jgi:uncharacterized protein YcbX
VQAGRVLALWRYPVKSMRGEALAHAQLDARGVVGDRMHALYDASRDEDADARPLTAREAPRLLAWTARYSAPAGADLDPSEPPLPTIEEPSGRRWTWGDPRLRAVLEADVGRPVRFARDVERIYDVPRTVLVTTEASRLALEAELGEPVDVRRFRPNLHLDLPNSPWDDLRWAGAVVHLSGGVRLEAFKPCRRCVIPTRDFRTQRKWPELLRHLAHAHELSFGIYARVTAAGTAAVGEEVALDPMAADSPSA